MFGINIDFYYERHGIRKDDINRVFNNALARTERSDLFEIKLNIQHRPTTIKLDESKHISFFEISSGSPLIMYSSGYLNAKKAKLNFIHEGNLEYDIPFMMNSNSINKTDDLSSFIKEKPFEEKVMKILQEVISSYFNFSNHISKIWFPQSFNETVFVVGGPDFDESDAADKEKRKNPSLNADIYGYGDKDTFIDSCIFLSKYFSGAKLVRCSSNDKVIYDNENMVIIGGPGTDDKDGNKYCRYFMEKMNTRFRYVKKENEFCIRENGHDYVAVVDKETNQLIKDYGYFACFKNPHNPKKRVILINGIYTMGVLCAFLAFSDRENTEMNYEKVLLKVNKDKRQRDKMISEEIVEFECLLEVNVVNNRPRVPVVKESNIYFFPSGTESSGKIKKDGETAEVNKKQQIKIILQEAIENGHIERLELSRMKKIIIENNLSNDIVDEIYDALSENTAIPEYVFNALKQLLYV